MQPTAERRLHLTAYGVVLVTTVLTLSSFAPPLLLALLAVPGLLRRRRARFVARQPAAMPTILQNGMDWNRTGW